MNELFYGIPVWQIIFAGATILLFIILFAMISMIGAKYKSLKIRYDEFMAGTTATNLEELVDSYMVRVDEVYKKGREIETEINAIQRTLIKCVQKVGIVRYNAFEDVGSDLSFVIALMDKNEDGYLLNGIYSRDTSTVYAKPLLHGKSKIPLSSEEMQAIELAKKSNME